MDISASKNAMISHLNAVVALAISIQTQDDLAIMYPMIFFALTNVAMDVLPSRMFKLQHDECPSRPDCKPSAGGSGEWCICMFESIYFILQFMECVGSSYIGYI